jgi:hypothetical protein
MWSYTSTTPLHVHDVVFKRAHTQPQIEPRLLGRTRRNLHTMPAELSLPVRNKKKIAEILERVQSTQF